MGLLNRNHKPLLKYIEKVSDEQAEDGSFVQYCAIRIIYHLTNPDVVADNVAALSKSVSNMLHEAGIPLPERFNDFIMGGLGLLLEKGFIVGNDEWVLTDKSTGKHETIRLEEPEYSFREMYSDKQKKTLENACNKLLGKHFPKTLDKKAVTISQLWFSGLADWEKRKLHITHMLNGTEIQLRKLIREKYKDYPDWTRNPDYVADGTITEMYESTKRYPETKTRKGGRVAYKEYVAPRYHGTPKSGVDAFLNACTLPELSDIIHKNRKEFDDIFQSDGKQGKSYDPFKIPYVALSSVKTIRNLVSHNDEQIPWDDDMVYDAKHNCEYIINAVTAYLDR